MLHEDVIKVCEAVLGTLTVKDPPTQILVEPLKLVNTRKHYLQIQEMAMCTKMAPSYAYIFMGTFMA